MIETRRISSWSEAAVYQGAWNALVMNQSQGEADSQSVLPSLFQTFEWNQTWWQVFGAPDYTLLLLAAFEDTLLVGIAPFMIKRHVVYFIGASSTNFDSDYCSFIIKDHREDIIDALAGWFNLNSDCWNSFELTNMVGDSLVLARLQKLFEGRYKSYYISDAPVYFLGNTDDDNVLLNRKSLKYSQSFYKKRGALTYEHWDSAEDIYPKLQVFFELHNRRWSSSSRSGKFNNKRYQQFYERLVDKLAPKGWLRLFAAKLDGDAFAWVFGFEFQNKFYYYTPSSEIIPGHSAGTVLLAHLFEYAISQKLTEFDFMAGSEEYKCRYANGSRQLYQFRAYRSRFRFFLFKIIMCCRAFVRRFLSGKGAS